MRRHLLHPGTSPAAVPDFTDGNGSFHIIQLVSSTDADCPISQGWEYVTDQFTAGSFTRTDIAFSIVVP